MSVEINIHTKKCKINKAGARTQPECVNMSEDKMIEIQAEAYYRAMKRIEEEKKECIKEDFEKCTYTVWNKVSYMLNVIFFPWKINKKFKLERADDSLLVIIVSWLLKTIGTVLWVGGGIIVANAIYKFVFIEKILNYLTGCLIGICSILFGSVIILAGSEFSSETDSNKIYAYSGSIIAIISCIVSIVAIIVSKS